MQNEPRRSAETPNSLKDLKDMSNKTPEPEKESTSQTGANSPRGSGRSSLSCPINRGGLGAEEAPRARRRRRGGRKKGGRRGKGGGTGGGGEESRPLSPADV